MNPAATRWIDLDLQRLRARSADEWRRAHALAKAIALHWIRALGGDLDDVVQEALTALDAELDRLHANAVPPSCALCTIFFQKAAHVLRSRRTQDKLQARLPAEPSPEPRRPDLALDHQKVVHAYEAALRSELESGSETDREILHATLLGRNGKEISVSIGLAESTISWRKGRIVERLRAQLREILEESGAAALTTGDEER